MFRIYVLWLTYSLLFRCSWTQSTKAPCVLRIMANIFNPIVRSNTVRNKPRFPASPLQPATPRPFLPPSHYAAAGGFSTSFSNKSGQQTVDAVSPKSSRRDHTPRTYSKNAAPVSRTPQVQDSDSFSEVISFQEIPSPRTNSHLRREASRASIPDLETQLLPSLRDTIDRMTRPPSTSFDPAPSYLDDAQRDHENRSKHRRHISPEPMTPPWNHPPRVKTPVKSALKSSLRSPTPRLFTADTSAAPPSMASPSFKSGKNLLSRKGSGTRESPLTDKVSRKWSLKVLFLALITQPR